MRINKARAQTAAQLMANKVYDEQIKNAYDALRQHAECILAQRVPAIVLDASQQYPNMIGTTNEVYVYWNGRRYYITIAFMVPYYCRRVDEKLDDELRDKLYGLCKIILQRENAKDDYFEKATKTLLELATKSKIEQFFPEACDYIEWPVEKSLPMEIVPSELRALIRKAK